jgi:hypothetical protein
MITTFAVTKVLTGVFEKYLNSAGRVIDDG